MPRFDDWDGGVAAGEQSALRWAKGEFHDYEEKLVAEEARTVNVAAMLMEVLDILDRAPWHAYYTWRRTGGLAQAGVVRAWQKERDDVMERARALLGGIV